MAWTTLPEHIDTLIQIAFTEHMVDRAGGLKRPLSHEAGISHLVISIVHLAAAYGVTDELPDFIGGVMWREMNPAVFA